MSSVLKAWHPVGKDVVRDAVFGRLGNNGGLGKTIVSGATNTVDAFSNDNQSFLIVGTVNGGVFLKSIGDKKQNQSQPWRWISNPSSGYRGSQGIGKLEISENGKLLAVGQGNSSNFNKISEESRGLEFGRLKADGSVNWIDQPKKYREQLLGHNIRSLQWLDSRTLLAFSLKSKDQSGLLEDSGSVIAAFLDKKGRLKKIQIEDLNRRNFVFASQPEVSVFAGYDSYLDGNLNEIHFALNANIQKQKSDSLELYELQGGIYKDLLRQYAQEGAVIRRVEIAQQLVGQRYIVFVGSSRDNPPDYSANAIHRIDRLEIDPGSLQIVGIKSFEADYGEIGSNQASTDYFYGNFSFSIDPRSTDARGVFLGGNHFLDSEESRAIAPAGGLVYVDFKFDKPVVSHRLYGPRIEFSPKGQEGLVWPIYPGQPHADSRDINYLQTDSGPLLIQVDDGGVWSLPLKRKAGAGFESESFWTSLSGPGLNAFEVMMTDWHSQSNGLISSYQDNAASYAREGESYANNLWYGDGEIAVIDDANSSTPADAYLSSHQYIANGEIGRLKIGNDGFLESLDNIDFLLQDVPGSKPLRWQDTTEAVADEHIPFILPFELNPYREKSLVIAGRRNIYEAIDVDSKEYPNSVIFRSLLTPRRSIQVHAMDNHGDVKDANYQGIYAALYVQGHPLILGRDAEDENYFMSETIYDGARDHREDLAHSMIVDLAHRPNPNGPDDIYWLQGGESLLFNVNEPLTPAEQVLSVRTSNGESKEFRPSELGIASDHDDQYKLQSIVFVPGRKNRADSLVVSGLTGHWISPLDEDGLPLGFKPMQWSKSYKNTTPNIYPTSVKYDPKDDLLIAGTLGKGTWIYRFSQEQSPQREPEKLLHSTDVNFTQFMEYDLNKRGHQEQSNFIIQIDRSILKKPQQDVSVDLILQDLEQWRRYVEFVSPLHFFDELVQNENASAMMNLLDPDGIELFGGKILNGKKAKVPLLFEDGNSMIALNFLPKSFELPEDDIVLDYKVKQNGGDAVSASTITLARPSRDSTEFEVHGALSEKSARIDSSGTQHFRSLDVDGFAEPHDPLIASLPSSEC